MAPLCGLLCLALSAVNAQTTAVAIAETDGRVLVSAPLAGRVSRQLDLMLTRPPAGGFQLAQVFINGRPVDGVEARIAPVSTGPGQARRWEVRLAGLRIDHKAPLSMDLVFDEPETAAEQARKRQLRAMTTAQKVGALLMRPLGPDDLDAHAQQIASGELGGVLLRWDQFTPEQARQFNERLQRIAGGSVSQPRVLVAIDNEPGAKFTQRKQTTNFPGQMALGATRDVTLARKSGRATANELNGQAHLNFGVVADVNSNPDNPIIGPRSFGEDPGTVASFVQETVRGYEGSGVVPVVKHFPGHGAVDVDSHTGLPIVNKTLEELERTEFLPFRAAIQAGAQCIMTAHILFPTLDTEMPATMSRKVIDYLRNQMGFQGVLVSDSMDMGAITSRFSPGDATVRAVGAGVDLVLVGKQDERQIHAALVTAVESGLIAMPRLDEAVLRVLRLRDQVFAKPPPSDFELAEHRALADEIAEKAITLVRDPRGLVPLRLSAQERLLAIVIENGSYDGEAQEFFAQLSRRHQGTATKILPFKPDAASSAGALAEARDADALVVGTYHWGAAEIKEQTGLVRQMAALGKPLVVVSFMSPYDARFMPPQAAILSAYGLTLPAARAAVRVLFGEIPARGRAPVTIPNGPPTT